MFQSLICWSNFWTNMYKNVHITKSESKLKLNMSLAQLQPQLVFLSINYRWWNHVFCLGFGCTSTMLYWLAERCLHWGVTGGRHCSHNCVMLMLVLQCFDTTQLVWKVTKFFRNVLQIQSIPHDQEYLMNKNFWKSKYFIEPFFKISTIFILSNYCSKHTFNNPSVTFLWVKVSYFLYKIQAFSIETGHCTKVYNIHKNI